MKNRCSSFCFLVLLSLFKGVSAEHDEIMVKYVIVPSACVAVLVICCCCCCCYLLNRKQKHQPRIRQHTPRYSRARRQRFLSSPFQQQASNSGVLQIVNLQSTSHQQAPGTTFVPNRRERHLPRGNPCEVLMLELPPPYSGEEPPPPYSGQQSPPPYSGEQPLSPYSGEESPPPYSGEDSPPPYSREQPSPPYFGEQSPPSCPEEESPQPSSLESPPNSVEELPPSSLATGRNSLPPYAVTILV